MKTIIFQKIKWIDYVNIARDRGIELAEVSLAVPKFEHDKQIFNSVKYGDFKAKVSQPRNLRKHQLFFVLLQKAVDNAVLEHIIDKEITLPDSPVIKVTAEMVYVVRQRFKDEVEAYRYMLKYLLLPLEENYTMAGDRYFEVCSQDFEHMDEIVFDGFFKASLAFTADVLGCAEGDLV